MKGKALFVSLAATLLAALSSACSGPGNLHQVDERIWRSSQPEKYHFASLEERGIGEVLSLRRWHDNRGKSDHLKLHQIRMNAGKIRDEDMVKALRILLRAEKPTLVHCFHGSDRTGVVVAMYRMVIQGWAREKAVAEFMDPKYGHHADWFPNIRQYLKSVDIEAMRRRVHAVE